MGRKNANARRRYNGASYGSFEELRNAGIRFDLSNGDFIGKKDRPRATKDTECSISMVQHWRTKKDLLSVSIRNDIAEKLGDYIKIGIVKFGLMERLYFIQTDSRLGFKLTQNGNQQSLRYYVRFPLNDGIKQNYTKYIGGHDLKYDYENNAYYVTARE